MIAFKVGDYAVYPGHGVGMIKAIEEKSFAGGAKVFFYILKIVDSEMTLMVPTHKAKDVRLFLKKK